jgi:hypothetical protein
LSIFLGDLVIVNKLLEKKKKKEKRSEETWVLKNEGKHSIVPWEYNSHMPPLLLRILNCLTEFASFNTLEIWKGQWEQPGII